MNIKAILDIDLVALESTEKVTMMLDMTAPITDAAKSRPGQAVEVVLDRSGSMNGPVFDSAKESILKLIDRLAPQDSFGLVAFDDQALIIAPMRTMTDHDLPALRQSIRQMQTGGQTDISGGYTMGLRELTRVATDAGATLLLISDGHANAGEQNPKVLAQVATTHAANKVTTSTIGLGTGYDEKILEALAQGGNGAHRKKQLEERLSMGALWNDLDFVFTQENGLPLDPGTPSHLFGKLIKQAGLREVRLHDLRHLHATELLRLGEQLHVVAQRLGHRDAMVTATIYAHVSNEQDETASQKFADASKRAI